MEAVLEGKELKKVRIAILVVLLLTILTQLIDNAFTLITPILVEKFSISTDVASWVASLGGIGIAIGFFAFSSFTDFFSEKRLLILGLILFCVPSVIGLLFQSSYYVVVIARFIQAVGGISTSALYLVLIARYLPASEQVIWMGLYCVIGISSYFKMFTRQSKTKKQCGLYWIFNISDFFYQCKLFNIKSKYYIIGYNDCSYRYF